MRISCYAVWFLILVKICSDKGTLTASTLVIISTEALEKNRHIVSSKVYVSKSFQNQLIITLTLVGGQSRSVGPFREQFYAFSPDFVDVSHCCFEILPFYICHFLLPCVMTMT